MREPIYKENIIHNELSKYHLASKNLLFPLHWHNEFEILHVQKGECSVNIEGRSFTLIPGNCVLINPGELHSGYSINSSACIVDAFVFHLDEVHDLFENQPSEQELYNIIMSLQTDDISDLYLFKSLIYALLHKMKRNGQTKMPSSFSTNAMIIKKVLSYINDKYYEPITIDTLAIISGFSKSHFIREFKKHTGTTPMSYLNQVRIEKSKNLLNSGSSITEISYRVGFNNSSYYIKIFKSFYGMSPKQYIKQEQMRH